MLLKLLGIVDIGVALMIILNEFGYLVPRIYILFAVIHALKALAFIKNFFSIVDVAIVFYTIILPFWSLPQLSIFIAIFLLYKGLYSLL